MDDKERKTHIDFGVNRSKVKVIVTFPQRQGVRSISPAVQTAEVYNVFVPFQALADIDCVYAVTARNLNFLRQVSASKEERDASNDVKKKLADFDVEVR